jgi:hypothetical protein
MEYRRIPGPKTRTWGTLTTLGELKASGTRATRLLYAIPSTRFTKPTAYFHAR